VDVGALVDFRSPALDLDSVYGRGPDDQPYMYNGLQLRVGAPLQSASAKTGAKNDLFRLPDGVPILGDKRNDENKIVSQIHGAMIRLHNKVVADDALIQAAGGDISSDTSRFLSAAQIVRWHYQWVVVFDYLNRVCEPGMVTEVLNPGGMPRLQNYLKANAEFAYLPVEFSGAAFRFGHSMVRPSYSLNSLVLTRAGGDSKAERIPTFSAVPGSDQNLNGFPGTLPPSWGLDFGFLFEVAPSDETVGQNFKLPQPSYRIDALLVSPLSNLPEFFKASAQPGTTLVGNLAFRNLLRGQMLSLPSGQTIANLLGIAPLTDDILWGAGSSRLDETQLSDDDKEEIEETKDKRQAFREKWVDAPGAPLKNNAPLWYYILREAEHHGVTRNPNDPGVGFGGQHLGPVGSRIVAETLIGLLWMDKSSFLHDLRGFTPLPQISGGGDLTLGKLLHFALS
jgi:hypothetical protein